jgi:competence protein ComEA
MKPLLLIIYGLLLGLLVAGLILLIAQPQHGSPITLYPAPTPTRTSIPGPTDTPEPIRVQIGGEILQPGIYALQEYSRLEDLIDLAGGFTFRADIERVNLAALLRDGDYFFIPAEDENIPETARNAPSNLYTDQDPIYDYPLDLNDASQEALDSIPGIGPSKAEDILTYKESIGRFTILEELLNVPGIGEITLESLRDYLIVEP